MKATAKRTIRGMGINEHIERFNITFNVDRDSGRVNSKTLYAGAYRLLRTSNLKETKYLLKAMTGVHLTSSIYFFKNTRRNRKLLGELCQKKLKISR